MSAIPGYVVRDAVCYASAMDPLHATIEEFAADGYTHVMLLPSTPHDEVEADQLASSHLDGFRNLTTVGAASLRGARVRAVY